MPEVAFLQRDDTLLIGPADGALIEYLAQMKKLYIKFYDLVIVLVSDREKQNRYFVLLA